MTAARDRILAAARAGLRRGQLPVVSQVITRAGVSRATFYRTFGSRLQLLRELELEPEPDGRRRILEAAGELLARDGLARLSMDELAAKAGVSRASLYRVYPGKAALFAAMVKAFAPIDVVVETMGRLQGGKPEDVMPEVAVTVWRAVSDHLGMIRPLLFEVAALGPDVRETVLEEAAPRMIGALGGYMLAQMEAGRLRRTHPLIAIQSFIGPIIVHVLLQPMVAEGLGISIDSEAAVREFADNWVRGMTPP
ncbi:MAG: TetR/AcrR family transcriptional regulator [Chloroflexi bacterium]|nr:MAG: TetR/AcrR family transcriptional regulator [Chloroflexota bacterium]